MRLANRLNEMRLLWLTSFMVQSCTGRIYDLDDSDLGLNPLEAASEFLPLAHSRRLQGCSDQFVRNGAMEGNTGASLWGATLGGAVRDRLDGVDDSPKSLESYERTTKESGPSYDLDAKCFTPDKQYVLMSQVKILLENDKLFGVIDKQAAPNSEIFLGLALRMETSDGKSTSIALPNEDPSSWINGGWNVYRAVFTANELMLASSKLFLHFFGTSVGTKIILDDVSLEEHIVRNVTCSKTLFEDTAEKGLQYNWNIVAQGALDIIGGGYESELAYINRYKRDGWDGIKREINKDCIIPGAPYDLTANIRLITVKGKATACAKRSQGVGAKSSCPLVSLDMYIPGSKPIKQRRWTLDKLFLKWQKKSYNDVLMKFKVKDDVLNAEKVELSIIGTSKNTFVILDNIRFFVGCEALFINNYAELKHTQFWTVTGGGAVRLTGKRYSGKKAYIHTGRPSADAGLGQLIDAHCLKGGRKFEFIAKTMILSDRSKQVVVDKWAKEGDDTYLILTLQVTLASGEVKSFDYPNEDRSWWKQGAFNQYRAVFAAGPEFETATKALLYMRGPKPGYMIVLDDIFVVEFKRNCFDLLLISEEETTNKDFKNGAERVVGWKISEPSYLNSKSFTGEKGNKAFLEHSDRIAGDPGVSHDLDPNCFFEGMNYSFSTRLKIRSSEDKKIVCSKDVQILEDINACPFVGIRMSLPSGDKWMYGRVSKEWDRNGWNEISFDFTASADLANALNVTLIITGPPPGVKILFDGIEMNGIWPSTAPSFVPSSLPSASPTFSPTSLPSISPSSSPSTSPSGAATTAPSDRPSMPPSISPTVFPTTDPTSAPSITHSFLPSISPTISSQPTLRPCIPLAFNGDAETGSTKGWVISFGGKIDTISGGADGSLQAYNYYSRTSHSSGPEQIIPNDCIEEGVQYEFTAKITLRDEDNNPFFCSKKARWRTDFFCVVLLIKRENLSGTKFINFANDDSSYWIENEFNTFRTVFTATDDMASLKSFHISLIGPRAGVSIIFDEVEIHKYGGSAIPCNELILNGDMQRGEIGWKAINGGELKAQKKGTNIDSFVLKNFNRDTSYSGISQELNALCIIPGIFLQFKATIMIVDKQGDPITCDKSIETMGHVDRCPSVSLHITYPTTTESVQLKNEILSEWVADDFNLYLSTFEGLNLQDADSVSLIISGIRDDASIVIDEISLDKTAQPSGRGFDPDGLDEDQLYGVLQSRKSFDGDEGTQNLSPTSKPTKSPNKSSPINACSELIKSGNAENENTEGWSAAFGGKVSINAHGANGSKRSFESYGRLFAASGPKHFLAIDCLKEGDQFELTAYIKLKDKSGEPLKSNKHAVWGEDSFLTASIYLEKPSGDEIINLPNEDPSQWMETDFNLYRSVSTVTPDFSGASKVFFYFRGPGVGVSLDFDDVSLARYTPPKRDCKELIPYGKAKAQNLLGWSVTALGGYININHGVGDGGDMFFENGERTSQYSGPKHVIDTSCLVNSEYGFEAYIKLVSKGGDPVPCDMGAARNNGIICPLVMIEFIVGQEKKVYELENLLPAQGNPRKFNRYYSTFSMTEELSSADSAFLYINGPSPEVTILFDEITFNVREVPDCNKLVSNGGAEDGGTVPWKVFFSGDLNVVKGGSNNTQNAFLYNGRTSYTSGPKQSVATQCLVVGTQYVFKAKIKLEDEKGGPFFCNMGAEWKSEFHCVILSIKVSDTSGTKILNLANENPGLWRESDFNGFQAVFTATDDLLVGKDIFFILRGPKAGVSIIFDEVSITTSEAML